jgi:hypothetical protein
MVRHVAVHHAAQRPVFHPMISVSPYRVDPALYSLRYSICRSNFRSDCQTGLHDGLQHRRAVDVQWFEPVGIDAAL